jgi:tetratricopeptide (TPR) repeat protein
VARYKRRDFNPRKLGRDLGVRALVTGRLAKLNGALVIAAELVETADGSRLWGEDYRPQQTGILAIQDEIAREISERLKVQMTLEERKRFVKRYTRDPEAYTLYLKGRFHWNKRTGDGLQKGIDCFEKAIEKDPSYALAYSGLADCYNLLSLYSVLPPQKTMPKAKAAVRKALQIDSSLAEAHTSLAYTYFYYDWDWTSAEREFRTAIELNPNYATAHHWYHELLTALGRFEEQMAEIQQAQQLDPLSLIINTDVGWGLYFGRAYDQAVDQLRRTLELDSNFAVAHLMLGLAYAQQNRLAEALNSLDKAISLSDRDPLTLAIAALGYVHAVSGRNSEAWKIIDRLKGLSQSRYASDYCQAMVLTGLGERAKAIALLEGAFRERYDRLVYLKVEPIFDTLRDDPKFRKLIRSIGL